MSVELVWKMKVTKRIVSGKEYPTLSLPVEFKELIGREVEIRYKDGKIIITPLEEATEK